MYKLLIADDEQIEREAVKFIVNEHFDGIFEIREAVNGREALELAGQFQPDIIFFDIKMPGVNGLQAASRIRETLPECRIIIVSAYHYFNYAKEAVSLGVDDYITKPAPVDTVVATVRRIIGQIEEKQLQRQLNEEKERRLKQLTQYFEDDLLVLIAYGEVDETVLAEYFKVLNPHYQAFLSAVVAVDYQKTSGATLAEIDKPALKKQLVEEMKRWISREGYHAFIRSVGTEIYILLLLEEAPDEYRSRLMGIELFAKLKDTLPEALQTPMNIGIGNVCAGASQIHHAFLQAKTALGYDTTPGSITSYGDIQKGTPHPIYPANKEKKLFQCILQGNPDGAQQLLEELLDWLLENTFSLEGFGQKVYELLLVLGRETVMNANLTEFRNDPEELRANIRLCRQKEDICRFAANFLAAKIQEVNTIKISRANALLTKAIEYMEDHYQKSDLSLEDLASLIHISPFYLSKIFKREKGQNFIDYLTAIRIRKAKEYLADPLLTVKDVCYRTGYKDPNYFARVFKKSCGITPTDYQAKIRR